jgi:myxalamid-type polyketide synthase MxaE and MxaD
MPDPARIEPDYPLNELGLDSLLAIELRNRLGAALGAKQPATLLFNYPSVAALAQHFASELIPAAPDTQPAARAETAIEAEIAALSDAELEALIEEEFGALQKT